MANEVDKYIAGFPEEVQLKLDEIRSIIRKNAPDAFEKMSYGIPTFDLNGNLVHFAGYKHHVGFYPGANGIEAFKDEFEKYKWAKGSVQFPLDKKLPVTLITRIVKYRVKQNLEKKQK
ncbi:MAG: iron chaperone [Flavobacteriales bacterium]